MFLRTSTAQGLDGDGNKLFYLEFAMASEGFTKLLQAIKSHCKDLSKVKAAMESTGCYHMNLFCFLASEGLSCFVISSSSCVVRQDNIFRVYYLKRRTEGLPFKKAIFTTAHKLFQPEFGADISRRRKESGI
jgi:hypothetical protein